ncbi:GntR family transcriptional regulator [Frigidibacter sp. MR17.14]|uniref:GntR family transcriptional regulator n=1 Tax=Frigidibacter sp. MR17.14 TaxID=3126509 RepID=UPI003012D93B
MPTVSALKLETRRPQTDLDFVYTELKQFCMMGEFEPGQKLTLQELSEVFGTSHMPIREALNRLVAARALDAPPRRSICVPQATVQRLDALLPLRLLLEGQSTELAARRIDEAGIRELRGIDARMNDPVLQEDIKAYLRLNQQFHFTVYRACGNEDLIDLVELLWMRYGPLMSVVRGGVLSVSGHARHQEVIAALTARDGAAAAAAMQADIGEAAVSIRAAISRAG